MAEFNLTLIQTSKQKPQNNNAMQTNTVQYYYYTLTLLVQPLYRQLRLYFINTSYSMQLPMHFMASIKVTLCRNMRMSSPTT